MSHWVDAAATLGINLTAQQITHFATYQALLLSWNARMNLTAIVEPHEIEIRHFLDSLTCSTATGDLSGQRVVDVGTGAGFPGLPLKILYPTMQLTLVESVAKKTGFLRAVVDALALADVTILAERAESVGQMPDHRERYDWAVARSVAHLGVLVEYLLPLVTVGGHMLAQKGDSGDRESAESTHAIITLGGGSHTIHKIQLPERELTHQLIVIPKVRPTPSQYPRRPGLPRKRPL